MGRHVLCFVAEEQLTVLETDSGDPETMAIGVFEVVHPNRAKSCGARAAELALVTRSSAPSRALPAGVVDVRDGAAFAGEDKLRMPAPQFSITDRAVRFSTT